MSVNPVKEQTSQDFVLEVTEADILDVLSPFIARTYKQSDPEWRRLVRKLSLLSFLASLRRLFVDRFGGAYTSEKVGEIYDRNWSRTSPAEPGALRATRPSVWGERAYMLDARGLKRVYLLCMMRILAALEPENALEVGFGGGQQILPLAARFPEIAFSGVELTEAGVATAGRIAQSGELPPAIVEFSPEPLSDISGLQRLQLQQGNATSLPFADNSFEVVYTVLAVEQMESVRAAALAELVRVSRRYVVMFEPFAEWNQTFLRRAFIRASGYFNGSIAEVAALGCRPVCIRGDLPAPVRQGNGLVIFEKR